MDNIKIDLLDKSDLSDGPTKELLNEYGLATENTDLSILNSGHVNAFNNYGNKSFTWYFTKIINYDRYNPRRNDPIIVIIDDRGMFYPSEYYNRHGIRPKLIMPEDIFNQLIENNTADNDGIIEVELGEYPQFAPEPDIQLELENQYKDGLIKSKIDTYTFDGISKTNPDKYNNHPFQPITYPVYEYKGKKYIRFKANSGNILGVDLSNEQKYRDGDYVWLEVSPIKWLAIPQEKTLISKYSLLAGIRFHSDDNYNSFEETEMYRFLNNYMLPEILQNNKVTLDNIKRNYKEQITKFESIINQDGTLTEEELSALQDAIEQEKSKKQR